MTQPPLVKDARLNILYYGVPYTIRCNGQWWEFVDNGSKEIEWDKVEDGVFMSREQCEELFIAGENYSDGQFRKLEYGQPNDFPDKDEVVNNLFNTQNLKA